MTSRRTRGAAGRGAVRRRCRRAAVLAAVVLLGGAAGTESALSEQGHADVDHGEPGGRAPEGR
ncbi:hypothetical protein ACF1BE_03445 [Streptomyces sp. NPDC014991]|uniref:hypothetical protein n=1 Tax=Streptomyces sp. NPDC014991 TaxID=3364935 RepID=UPI0036FFB25F